MGCKFCTLSDCLACKILILPWGEDTRGEERIQLGSVSLRKSYFQGHSCLCSGTGHLCPASTVRKPGPGASGAAPTKAVPKVRIVVLSLSPLQASPGASSGSRQELGWVCGSEWNSRPTGLEALGHKCCFSQVVNALSPSPHFHTFSVPNTLHVQKQSGTHSQVSSGTPCWQYLQGNPCLHFSPLP